ncbi:beta-mannosidase [Actinoplanes sp. SE50]|uniref:glycoside hydrolase family 2 protein n=1 Tax=unclassified Actinoplanes TaxID=2626549 RepID=UPI00023ED042|nr:MULTISPECIES: glycoside hydrolase family 2 TIM barrel-domain containing protein [unclassified Actinoplanes]AEV83840.1 beta-mannosidase [Actinoplanes sp. SE50/110]ATO82016.1 beta-mannosidase [Actinoplanes sp. SE50]SLL99424.1 beta-mannosidase [Actinoplanes sp. SE50/110]
MIRTDLHSGWTVRAVGGPVPAEIAAGTVPATVPGTVHTDLLDAELIPDPYLGENESLLVWFHRAAWLYATTLRAAPAAPDERVDLVFDGLDTVATITLGDAELGRTANMHRGHRFDVRDRLHGAPLPLSVRFDSALDYAERLQKVIGERPRPYPHPFNAVRKMACSFGWDWGPDLQTAGIWKPVRLERWRVARLASVRPLATVDADGRTGKCRISIEVERSGLAAATALTAEVAVGSQTVPVTLPATADAVTTEITVPDAPVWWPVGYGDQPLVDVRVVLRDGDGDLDVFDTRVGFRTVTLDETPDAVGTPFTLIVNGQPIFVRGLNWIPEDHLLTRLTRARYAAAIERAVEANANLLRVWGGGIYESDDFYAECDERGVLVWQDFPLACAAYSEEEPIRSEILAEARENVARLAPHPSLILWNGGNENIWGHQDWDWKPRLNGQTWGAGYYYRDFPALLADLDPSRPYHPGSPSSPGHDPEIIHPNDDRHGTRHEWEAWNRQDYTHHANFLPRFCAEFGWQAPATWSTLRESLAPEDFDQESPAFLLHQKAAGGNDKLDTGLAHHMRVPADFAEWHWATQLNQARATAYAVHHLRGHAPRTMGSILWQLNDCWPVTSWAVVDGAGRRKPAWYALRRAYAPRLLSLRFPPGSPDGALVAVNDSPTPWRGTVRVRRVSFTGEPLAEGTVELDVAPRSGSVVPLDAGLTTPGDVTREVLVADADGLRATHLFAEDFDLAYDPSPLTADITPAEGGYCITVTASRFARDVALLTDKIDPASSVDDLLVDLLAGESHTFHVRTTWADPAAFGAPGVLVAANTLAAATEA